MGCRRSVGDCLIEKRNLIVFAYKVPASFLSGKRERVKLEGDVLPGDPSRIYLYVKERISEASIGIWGFALCESVWPFV